MEIHREVDVKNHTFTFQQKTEKSTRILDFDYKKCNGCAVCVFACPVNAIELGPVSEIATGLDAPPILLDHIKCTYCGICAAVCPFKAFNFLENGEKVEFPLALVDHAKILEDKCTGCKLCQEVCPTGAVKREIKIKREDFPEKNQNLIGELKIDKDKCNLCGICADFCPAFILIEKEVGPDTIIPFDQLLFDQTQCDYCKLCEEICPEDAITVEGERIKGQLPDVFGRVWIELDNCSHCDYCVKICPYDAVENTKTGDGNLILYEGRLHKCDPVGCAACIKICKHNRVWYVSKKDGKIAFNEDFCTYCGACEYACPYDLIEVKKEAIFTRELINIPQPWRESWEMAIERIISKERIKELERKAVSGKPALEPVEEEEREVLISPNQKYIQQQLEKVIANLTSPKVRVLMERGKEDSVYKLLVE